MSNLVQVTCCDCGSEFNISYSAYSNHLKKNKAFRCKSCMSKYRTGLMKKINSNRSPEEKQKQKEAVARSKKQYWGSISKEEKNKHLEKLNAASKEWRENETDEERDRISKIHSESNKRRWIDMSEDEKKEFIQRCKDAWENKTDKDAFGAAIRERWASMDNTKYQQVRTNMSAAKKQWWDDISPDKLEKLSNKISNTLKDRWSKAPDSEREKISIREKERWYNLPEEEKEKYRLRGIEWAKKRSEWWSSLEENEKNSVIHKALTSRRNNHLTEIFEEKFNSLNLNSSIHLEKEYLVSQNGYKHFWDYAIFLNNELKMLIDVDGAYYHADNCDYDGIHSRFQSDFIRSEVIPENVIPCIITEVNFNDTFNRMIRLMQLSYDEYVEEMLSEMNNQPFPNQSYSNIELCQSYNKLQQFNKYDDIGVDSRLGDRIVYHFHQSIWDGIKESWKDSEWLRGTITNHKIYQNYFNRNKILQSLMPTKILSAGRAKMIINKYLSQYDIIFNPNNRYSGILLGTIASNKRYIGMDYSPIRRKEVNDLLSFLRDNKVKFDAIVLSGTSSTNEYSCLFTSIFDNVDTRIYGYLNVYKCERYVFVVDKTEKFNDFIIYEDEDIVVVIIDRKER